MRVPHLPPLYYLHNFQLVHEWVWQHSADLLDESQQALSVAFRSLPEHAQALLVRLFMRKGLWFRTDKWQYPEITDIPDALSRLSHAAWVFRPACLPVEQVGPLLTVPELRQHFMSLNLSGRKAQMLDVLQQAFPDGLPSTLPIVQLSDSAQHWAQRLLLLFFGNTHQDWTQFVLSDLGLHRYEQVRFSAGSRAFQTLAEVRAYEQLAACRQSAAQASEQDRPELLSHLVAAVQALDVDSAWLAERKSKTLFVLGQWAEKNGSHLALAAQAYAASQWPMAGLRHVRVLERLGKYQQAWHHAQALLDRSPPEAIVQKLIRILPRLQKQLTGQQPYRVSSPFRPQQDSLTLNADAPQCSIEAQVQAHYQQPDSPVYYVENTLIQALFALWCWDALFEPVAGAFFHPYQRGPADIYSPDFYERRKNSFDQAWGTLDNGQYKNLILARWQSKHGLQCHWVQWSSLSTELLVLALNCVPADHLRVMFKRLLMDLRENRSGLPDLIRFWPEHERYEWIEVKGPGDRLQDNQLRWLQYFSQHHIPARVCYVRWA